MPLAALARVRPPPPATTHTPAATATAAAAATAGELGLVFERAVEVAGAMAVTVMRLRTLRVQG